MEGPFRWPCCCCRIPLSNEPPSRAWWFQSGWEITFLHIVIIIKVLFSFIFLIFSCGCCTQLLQSNLNSFFFFLSFLPNWVSNSSPDLRSINDFFKNKKRKGKISIFLLVGLKCKTGLLARTLLSLKGKNVRYTVQEGERETMGNSRQPIYRCPVHFFCSALLAFFRSIITTCGADAANISTHKVQMDSVLTPTTKREGRDEPVNNSKIPDW